MYGIDNVDKKSADVFSLAMIFYQILFRQEPYPDSFGYKIGRKKVPKKSFKQNLTLLLGPNDTFRCPTFPAETIKEMDPKILNLMKKSWSENSSERPTIIEIKNCLSGFTKK